MKITPILIGIVLVLAAASRVESNRLGGKKPGAGANLVGRVLPKSRGQPFPKPQSHITTDTQHRLDERNFVFQFARGSQVCDVLTLAFNRYYKIIFRPHHDGGLKTDRTPPPHPHHEHETLLKRVIVDVKEPCEEYPSLESDESYTLQIAGDFASIDSKSLWGALRGLETFSQLVIKDGIGTFLVNDTYIVDFPRFRHRGVLLDTSRHYLDPEIIKIHIDALAANKMNVFHWHIVDDESFPYESYTFPELSQRGAYDPYYHVYTQETVKDIIEFARLRGVRVVPEFDSPGHTQSWGKSMPQFLAACFDDARRANGQFGPVDPSKNETYMFWKRFIKELSQVFPDDYLHLGGDEVDFTCWQSNPGITEFMSQMGFGSDYTRLEQFYEQNLLDIVKSVSPRTNYIVWQEVIDNNVKVKPETVVQVWKDHWQDEMSSVTAQGYRAILSNCWYLDYISFGSDWIKYYQCEPMNFTGNAQQKELVIGGEACVWGEYVDGTNVIQRTWPRSSAVAERLWSAKEVTDVPDASVRLEEHRCRMISRGIHAQPFDGSGFCEYEYKKVNLD